MRLERVRVRGFRSIDDAELIDCGELNVLIGKNNSGKFNVLLAIDTFFKCGRRDGYVVTIDPPIGREIDFFDRDTQRPIDITLTFALAPAERDSLIQDLVTEAPHMRNAVEGIDPSLRLSITVRIASSPASYAFVSTISLLGSEYHGEESSAGEWILLRVGAEAAAELQVQLARSQELVDIAQGIQSAAGHIEAYEWEALSRDLAEREGTHSIRYLVSRFASPAASSRAAEETASKMRDMIQASPSYDDFKREVQSVVSGLQEQAATIRTEPLTNKITTFSGEEPAIPGYITNLLCKVGAVKVLRLTERRERIGEAEASQLLSLKVSRSGTETFRNIQETVSALLGVQIDAWASSNSATSRRFGLEGPFERDAELDIDKFLVEVNGAGVREALRLILDVEFEHPEVLLVEEPEIHLHPALEISVLQYLKRISSKCQIFLTTHSTNFLDTGEMKNVYLVSKDTSTGVEMLDPEDAEAQIPKELGIRMSSLFMYDRLVFVEGGTDEAILREWASTLGLNFGQANVGFIAMGGARNFAHFAAERTLSFLTKRRVDVWFLLDRDERDDPEIAALQGRLADKAHLKVLSRREIENYLISPRALSKFISCSQAQSGTRVQQTVAEADVARKIDECAEELKQFAVDKRVVRSSCGPVHPATQEFFDRSKDVPITTKVKEELQRVIEILQQNKDTIDQVYGEQLAVVDKEWQDGKLNIVPGDLLLDCVCQKYGVRFKKERDGVRLAALMDRDEIAPEMKDILREIGCYVAPR